MKAYKIMNSLTTAKWRWQNFCYADKTSQLVIIVAVHIAVAWPLQCVSNFLYNNFLNIYIKPRFGSTLHWWVMYSDAQAFRQRRFLSTQHKTPATIDATIRSVNCINKTMRRGTLISLCVVPRARAPLSIHTWKCLFAWLWFAFFLFCLFGRAYHIWHYTNRRIFGQLCMP